MVLLTRPIVGQAVPLAIAFLNVGGAFAPRLIAWPRARCRGTQVPPTLKGSLRPRLRRACLAIFCSHGALSPLCCAVTARRQSRLDYPLAGAVAACRLSPRRHRL